MRGESDATGLNGVTLRAYLPVRIRTSEANSNRGKHINELPMDQCAFALLTFLTISNFIDATKVNPSNQFTSPTIT